MDDIDRANAQIDAYRAQQLGQKLVTGNGKTGSECSAVDLVGVELCEFLRMKLPPRKILLSPWLPAQGLTMVHAPRGIGKTWFALHVAYAVASAGRFLEWSASEAAAVTYIDGEMPAGLMQERLVKIVQAAEKQPAEPLSIITPDLNIKTGFPSLADPEGQQRFDRAIHPKTKLIVVDNLSCLAGGGDENRAEWWDPMQTWALRHRAAGRSILFVHHSGKGGSQRGTSRKEDVLDTVIGLRRVHESSRGDSAKFEVYFEKARGIWGTDTDPIAAQLIQDNAKGLVWVSSPLANSQDDQIKRMLDDGMKPSEIAADLGCNRATVYRRIKALGLKGS